MGRPDAVATFVDVVPSHHSRLHLLHRTPPGDDDADPSAPPAGGEEETTQAISAHSSQRGLLLRGGKSGVGGADETPFDETPVRDELEAEER